MKKPKVRLLTKFRNHVALNPLLLKGGSHDKTEKSKRRLAKVQLQNTEIV